MRMVETDQMRELRERNAKRLQEAKERLGERWLLHPNNEVFRKNTPYKPILTQATQTQQSN